MPWRKFIKRWTEALTSPPASLEDRSFGRESESQTLEAPKKRRAPRVAARFWAVFLDGPRTGALTADLTLEGCKVEGDFRGFVGAEVRLCLELHDASEPLHLKGRIVWAGCRQAGIQFLNLHVFDEVRLLRTLGHASIVPPSSYLPASQSLGKAYEYTLRPVGEGRYKLEIKDSIMEAV